jgi:3-oxoacyl-[acyl-carrier-protein] synthase II
MKRVVVTGLGTINSVGNNVDESFKAVVEGQCGIEKITLFDASQYPVQIAAEVKNFDPTEVMDKKEVKKADRFIQLGINDSISERFGIISASGIGGLGTIEKNSVVCQSRGPRRISPFFIPSSLVNMLGGFISIEHGLKGPSLSHVTACAASTHALADAVKTIATNGADKILVVGAESAICGAGVGGFASMKALSARNDDPQKASRPFDKDRDGFVMGEGAGALVIETLESAKARGAKIYAEIIGFGESADANHITAPVIDGPLRAMKAALAMAKETIGEDIKIDYVNAHGTSTPVGDGNESKAILDLFGDISNCPPVTSTKGQIGHCLGAAGAIEAIFAIKNLENQDEECNLDFVPNKSRKTQLTTVMSNNFGFGGTNGSIIFKKFID